MWRYTFTYEIEGVEQTWIVETESKSLELLLEMFDSNPDIPNGIQCRIDGVAL
jgi:hypothetical protein